MIINIEQPFKFAVSNSDPIVHFCKRLEDPPWHSGYNGTDSDKFGPMSTKFWSTMAQLYPEVAIMNPDAVVFIGPKLARSSSLCPLRHCLFPKRLQNWALIGYSKFEKFVIAFGHWTVTVALTRVIFHVTKDKYCTIIIVSINCRSCTFTHFADSPDPPHPHPPTPTPPPSTETKWNLRGTITYCWNTSFYED